MASKSKKTGKRKADATIVSGTIVIGPRKKPKLELKHLVLCQRIITLTCANRILELNRLQNDDKMDDDHNCTENCADLPSVDTKDQKAEPNGTALNEMPKSTEAAKTGSEPGGETETWVLDVRVAPTTCADEDEKQYVRKAASLITYFYQIRYESKALPKDAYIGCHILFDLAADLVKLSDADKLAKQFVLQQLQQVDTDATLNQIETVRKSLPENAGVHHVGSTEDELVVALSVKEGAAPLLNPSSPKVAKPILEACPIHVPDLGVQVKLYNELDVDICKNMTGGDLTKFIYAYESGVDQIIVGAS